MKRSVLAATAVVAALSLSSCNAIESTSTAATVGSADITVDQLQEVMKALAETEGGPPTDAATATIDGATARQYLTAMVRGEANEQFLAEHGEQITDADRQQGLTAAGTAMPEGLPADVERLIADSGAAPIAQQRVQAPSAEELERQYNTAPAGLGLVCVRQIVLSSEGAAQDVVDELAAGATFESLVPRSIDEATKANGGALQDQAGAPCLTTPEASTTLSTDVLSALATAAPSEIVGPVRGTGGWHVLQPRAFEDVADTVSSLATQYTGQLLYVGFITGLDVSIDPRFGRWDRFTASVVPLQPTSS